MLTLHLHFMEAKVVSQLLEAASLATALPPIQPLAQALPLLAFQVSAPLGVQQLPQATIQVLLAFQVPVQALC